MNILKRIVLYLVLLILIGIIIGYLYFIQGQKIEVDFIPSEFRFCNKIIVRGDAEYKEIVSWLRQNSEGWARDWNTPVAGLVYSYPAFSVVVYKGGVSVSYKTDYGFPRFIKSSNHNLPTVCENGS